MDALEPMVGLHPLLLEPALAHLGLTLFVEPELDRSFDVVFTT
jgi:hypothetical protein